MDMDDDITIKEEVSRFMSNFQRFLPKKKDLIVFEPQKVKFTTLCDVHAEAKSVFPMCFFGAKLVMLRQVMDKVKLVQQYSFGKPKDCYKCFNQLIHKEMEPKVADDGLIIDTAGSATATYTEVLDEGYKMSLTSRIRDLIASEIEVVIDKDNQNSTGSILCSLKDVEPSTLKVVTQFMYKVFPDFLIGTEVSLKPLAYPLSTPDFSISARYERPSFTLSSTVSKSGLQMCVYKQFSPDLRIAAVLNEGNRSGCSAVSLALHKNYGNGAELKIFVDSQRCGGFTFQKDVLFYEPHNEVPVLRLIGSTLIDRQRRVRFGIGFNLDL